jgi:hypothetical protein
VVLDGVPAAKVERVADSARDARHNGKGFVRSAFVARRSLRTVGSLVHEPVEAGAAGMWWSRPLPKTLVRSQVENGAVKGEMPNTMSHDAKSLYDSAFITDPPAH